MSEQPIDALSTERVRAGLGLANPRRLRVVRAGRPLPVPSVTGSHAA